MIKGRDTTSILGAMGMGLCPVTAATALSIFGLGILAPVWMWLSAGLLVAGLAGFILDYRRHRQIVPTALICSGRNAPVGGPLLAAGGPGLAGLAAVG
jgi:hypothetical protein